jgi:hypothetical protein
MAAHAAENAAAHIKAAAEEAVQGGKIAAADVDKIVRIWNFEICILLSFLSFFCHNNLTNSDVDKIVRIWNLKICSLLIFLS